MAKQIKKQAGKWEW